MLANTLCTYQFLGVFLRYIVQLGMAKDFASSETSVCNPSTLGPREIGKIVEVVRVDWSIQTVSKDPTVVHIEPPIIRKPLQTEPFLWSQVCSAQRG
jgi:hypothetical protein